MTGSIASHLNLEACGDEVGSHAVGRIAGIIERKLFKGQRLPNNVYISTR
jgi:hypothetical protein